MHEIGLAHSEDAPRRFPATPAANFRIHIRRAGSLDENKYRREDNKTE